MQTLVKDILAPRGPAAPAEDLALRMSGLNEARTVAYGSMADGSLDAVDRVARLVREIDRDHGFFPGRGAEPASPVRLARAGRGAARPGGAGRRSIRWKAGNGDARH